VAAARRDGATSRGPNAEKKTGEARTFEARWPGPILNGWTPGRAHVVTVNDYLAKRDAQWIGAVFHRLGMSVGLRSSTKGAFVSTRTFPADRRAPAQTCARSPRGEAYAGRRHVRHEQRARLRLPPRQPGRRPRQRVQRGHFFRDRGRGRQHPHRRGAHPADHLRAGRGVGRQVRPVRAARARG
jgi:hypothetical protein